MVGIKDLNLLNRLSRSDIKRKIPSHILTGSSFDSKTIWSKEPPVLPCLKSTSPGRWRASEGDFKCREFAGSVTAMVTAGRVTRGSPRQAELTDTKK